VKRLFCAAIIAASMTAAPALASETFAQYDQIGTADTLSYVNNGNLTGSLTTINPAIVTFDFLAGIPGLETQSALFTLSATAVGPAVPGLGTLQQLITNGQMTFTRTVPFGPGGLTNLLTVNFTNAVLSGPVGGRSGSVIASTPTSVVTFSSQFIDFTGSVDRSFALGLSGLSAPIGLGADGGLASFFADSDGTFSADAVQIPGGIPEPASWALLIIGFGGAGAMIRARRKALNFA
jgi:hypothetical protein